MKRLGLLAVCLLFGAPLLAQTFQSPVTFAWDPPAGATAYRLTLDDSQSVDAGAATQVVAVVPPGPHSATARARNAAGESLPSTPLLFTVAPPPPVVDPECAVPFGSKAVAIFVTSLQRTGSAGAGSQARLDFQLASPNSPIVQVAVRSHSVDLRAMGGTDLGALAGLWFTTPPAPGTYPLVVFAQNAYGCTREVLTTRTVTVP